MTDSRSELMALACNECIDRAYVVGEDDFQGVVQVLERFGLRLAASKPDREMVARAIDPDAFDAIDNPIFNRLDYDVDRTSSALDAADRVCLLLSGEVVQKSDGGASVELCECCNKNKSEHFMEWGEELCSECMAQAVADPDPAPPAGGR